VLDAVPVEAGLWPYRVAAPPPGVALAAHPVMMPPPALLPLDVGDPASVRCSDDKVANRNVRDFGWERSLARPFRDARRFPSTRWWPVPGATRTTLGLGFVHRSRDILCRAKP
jgi:hypothetical protein